MDAWSLLSPALQERSLSKHDVVLPFEDLAEAIESLARAGVATVGWEDWVRPVDGTRPHAISHSGTAPLQPERNETWADFIERCREWVLLRMRLSRDRWRVDGRSEWNDLYFCLYARAEK